MTKNEVRDAFAVTTGAPRDDVRMTDINRALYALQAHNPPLAAMLPGGGPKPTWQAVVMHVGAVAQLL